MKHNCTILLHCIIVGFSICLAVPRVTQLSTPRILYDWIQKLISGQKPGSHVELKKFGFYSASSNKKQFLPGKKVGTLVNGRRGHGVIFDGEKILVIGGYDGEGPVKNEVCSLEDSTMTCVEQSTVLGYYVYYPELFLVAEDFGKDPQNC